MVQIFLFWSRCGRSWAFFFLQRRKIHALVVSRHPSQGWRETGGKRHLLDSVNVCCAVGGTVRVVWVWGWFSVCFTPPPPLVIPNLNSAAVVGRGGETTPAQARDFKCFRPQSWRGINVKTSIISIFGEQHTHSLYPKSTPNSLVEWFQADTWSREAGHDAINTHTHTHGLKIK